MGDRTVTGKDIFYVSRSESPRDIAEPDLAEMVRVCGGCEGDGRRWYRGIGERRR
jgi:hypothetical protein